MAEFLSHVAKPSFDGIMFKSTQRQRGTTIVLFPYALLDETGEPPNFPVSLASEQLKLYRTDSISYAHEELDFHRPEGSRDVFVYGSTDSPPDEEAWDDWPD
jgi:hypothetical protein